MKHNEHFNNLLDISRVYFVLGKCQPAWGSITIKYEHSNTVLMLFATGFLDSKAKIMNRFTTEFKFNPLKCERFGYIEMRHLVLFSPMKYWNARTIKTLLSLSCQTVVLFLRKLCAPFQSSYFPQVFHWASRLERNCVNAFESSLYFSRHMSSAGIHAEFLWLSLMLYSLWPHLQLSCFDNRYILQMDSLSVFHEL